jgi:hypothetical protein
MSFDLRTQDLRQRLWIWRTFSRHLGVFAGVRFISVGFEVMTWSRSGRWISTWVNTSYHADHAAGTTRRFSGLLRCIADHAILEWFQGNSQDPPWALYCQHHVLLYVVLHFFLNQSGEWSLKVGYITCQGSMVNFIQFLGISCYIISLFGFNNVQKPIKSTWRDVDSWWEDFRVLRITSAAWYSAGFGA